MGFVWNFENLTAEIEALDPQDPVAEFEINAVIDSMDRSLETGRVTAGEYQCLLLKILAFETRVKRVKCLPRR